MGVVVVVVVVGFLVVVVVVVGFIVVVVVVGFIVVVVVDVTTAAGVEDIFGFLVVVVSKNPLRSLSTGIIVGKDILIGTSSSSLKYVFGSMFCRLLKPV